MARPRPGRFAARHGLVLLVVAACAAGALRARAGAPAPALETLLRERDGLVVRGAAVDVAGRSVFLAAPAGAPADGPADVFVVDAERGAEGRVIRAGGVRNLTRSRYGDEGGLAVEGTRVAFTTKIYGRVETITVVDLGGEDAALTADWGRLDRFMDAITNWQETGRLVGIDEHRFAVTSPAAGIEVRWEAGGRLAIVLDAAKTIAVDPRTGAGTGDAIKPLAREKGRRPFIHWLVDTVRDGGYLPDGTIDWAKGRFYAITESLDVLRYRLGGDEFEEDTAVTAARAASAEEFAKAGLGDWPPPEVPSKLKGLKWHGAPFPWLLRNAGAPEPLMLSTVRPYDERPGAIFELVAWDPGQVELAMVAGTREPMSATGHIGSGRVPRGARLMRLLGTFNGGFQGDHGNYGMMVDRATLLPPKDLSATVALFADRTVGFGSWPVGAPVPAHMLSYRQNLSPLVAEGVVNPHGRTWWGASTVKDDLEDESRTTRTGVCMTTAGKGVYFWARRANWREMADVMSSAGCTYGMHLDMNPGHCGSELYRVYDPEGAKYDVARTTEHMGHMNFPRWIKTDPRDFFYWTLVPVLPTLDVEVGGVKWSAAGLPQAGHPPSFVVGTYGAGDAAVTLLKMDPRRARPAFRAGTGEPEATTGAVGAGGLRAGAKGGPASTSAESAGATAAPAAGSAVVVVSLGVTNPVTMPGLMADRSLLFPPRAGLPTLAVRCGEAATATGTREECPLVTGKWGDGLDLAGDVLGFKQGLALSAAKASAAASGAHRLAVGVDGDGFVVIAATAKGDAAALEAALRAAGVAGDPTGFDLGGRPPALWAETPDGARRYILGSDVEAAGVSTLRLEPVPRERLARLWPEVDKVAPKKAPPPKPPAPPTKPTAPTAPTTPATPSTSTAPTPPAPTK